MTSAGPIPPPPLPGLADRRAAPPARRRCVRHEEREAVARCVACGGGFCRECITEHDGKLYCAPCFAREAAGSSAQPRARADWRRLRGLALTAGSVFCLVLGFYLVGRVLAAVPPDWHDGTIWREEFDR